jgi:hypothetical protein
MFRPGTSVQAVYDFLSTLEVGQKKVFDVKDAARPHMTLFDSSARPAISQIARITGKKFKTNVGPNVDGFPRMHVTRIS